MISFLRFFVLFYGVSLVPLCVGQTIDPDASLEKQLILAGGNRDQLEGALVALDGEQRASMEFLIRHMPGPDLTELSSDFLVENVKLAHQARNESRWQVPNEIFLNDVLPYANVDEVRERWRPAMYERAKRIIAGCDSPAEAAQRLNEKLFADVKVRYSTKRRKANQNPAESIEQGLASCTGLSILLADACRSVNVPARLVCIPKWSNKDGNHTWVEIWDDGKWYFTGAAEYDSKGLNRAWFASDAALANKDSRMNSIYAVSYRHTGTKLPTVWSERPFGVQAINVTDRYTKSAPRTATDKTRLMVRVLSKESGERINVPVRVINQADANESYEALSKDETADTNDLVTFEVLRKAAYEVRGGDASEIVTTDQAEVIVELSVSQEDGAQNNSSDKPVVAPLRHDEASAVAGKLYSEKLALLKESRAEEWKNRVIRLDDLEMKFDYKVFGEAPKDGRRLFISMHGGGNAPPDVNDQQWENQKKLYEPAEGIYLAPRAPTNTWNLWHQAHIDRFFSRLIEDAIALEGVDPDRVYLTGYSAGGDGVYQLAPRMADQLAAAAMMAGHPNDASPLGLRNIGFAIHVGGKDSAYKRNEVAQQWKQKLAELRSGDPGGYEHQVVVYPDHGHWMNREDASAIEWMSEFKRSALPDRVVWRQSAVTHQRFYWLSVAEEDQQPGALLDVSRSGNKFQIHAASGVNEFVIRLNNRMVDLKAPVVVSYQGRELANRIVESKMECIQKSLNERLDPAQIFSAELVVSLVQNP